MTALVIRDAVAVVEAEGRVRAGDVVSVDGIQASQVLMPSSSGAALSQRTSASESQVAVSSLAL